MKRIIYLAGGCFWGMEAYFKQLSGVITTEVGYANGNTTQPTYQEVCNNETGFVETLKLEYDDDFLTLKRILAAFFKVVNPTQLNRQQADIGSQYRSGIYYIENSNIIIINDYIRELQKSYSAKIVTEVLPIKNYFPAETYHQDYLSKNPSGYCHIDLTQKP
ncbi:MAG: peptide-methionine (S)-S-oxide reductase MsrA [Erysipelotrichaceae bacterium]